MMNCWLVIIKHFDWFLIIWSSDIPNHIELLLVSVDLNKIDAFKNRMDGCNIAHLNCRSFIIRKIINLWGLTEPHQSKPSLSFYNSSDLSPANSMDPNEWLWLPQWKCCSNGLWLAMLGLCRVTGQENLRGRDPDNF